VSKRNCLIKEKAHRIAKTTLFSVADHRGEGLSVRAGRAKVRDQPPEEKRVSRVTTAGDRYECSDTQGRKDAQVEGGREG